MLAPRRARHLAPPSSATSRARWARRSSPASPRSSCCRSSASPTPSALALIIALLDLIPLVGATVGAFLVGLVTIFNDFPTATIVWVIWSIIYQQIENTVIQPRIQSHTVKVQPIVVLIAVLFGSSLFGVLGALLAIPAAATIQICIREYRQYRSALDRRTGPSTRRHRPEPSPSGGGGRGRGRRRRRRR